MARIEAVKPALRLYEFSQGILPVLPMTDDSTRSWPRTYAAVIVVEVVTLLGLWWLQARFTI